MPERYSFITECIKDFKKATAIVGELGELCTNNVMVHEFNAIGGERSYFITGQILEVDSNLGCIELRTCFEEVGVAAAYIDAPFVGGINCKLQS